MPIVGSDYMMKKKLPTDAKIGDIFRLGGTVYHRDKNRWYSVDFEGHVIDVINDETSDETSAEEAYKRAMSIL